MDCYVFASSALLRLLFNLKFKLCSFCWWRRKNNFGPRRRVPLLHHSSRYECPYYVIMTLLLPVRADWTLNLSKGRENRLNHIGQVSLKLIDKETQHVIFYGHIHACSPSYTDEEW